jgi:hypothetical protein
MAEKKLYKQITNKEWFKLKELDIPKNYKLWKAYTNEK